MVILIGQRKENRGEGEEIGKKKEGTKRRRKEKGKRRKKEGKRKKERRKKKGRKEGKKIKKKTRPDPFHFDPTWGSGHNIVETVHLGSGRVWMKTDPIQPKYTPIWKGRVEFGWKPTRSSPNTLLYGMNLYFINNLVEYKPMYNQREIQ